MNLNENRIKYGAILNTGMASSGLVASAAALGVSTGGLVSRTAVAAAEQKARSMKIIVKICYHKIGNLTSES